MKKRLLCVTLVASLILSVVMPTTALAAKGKAPAHPNTVTQFEATMTVTWIEDTLFYQNVFPLDADGNVLPPPFNPADVVWWQVVGRQMTGEVSGDLAGTFSVTYSGILNWMQAGDIGGTLKIDTKPGTGRGVIYGTFQGFTAVVGGAPQLGFVDVAFFGDLVMSGGTGIYRHILGVAQFGAGIADPITLLLDPQGHVIDVQGEMALGGTYTRVSKP